MSITTTNDFMTRPLAEVRQDLGRLYCTVLLVPSR